jgi:hypothetical protein
MPAIKRFEAAIKTVQQLGWRPAWLYAKYQLKLRSGWLWLDTAPGGKWSGGIRPLRSVVQPGPRQAIEKALGTRRDQLFDEADEILAGRVRLFRGMPRELDLSAKGALKHWTSYTKQLPGGRDIKPTWEVGRFGWATVLARAYWLSGKEKYAEAFWTLTQRFLKENPIYRGPQWSSAQEVAIRLIALAFSYSLVADAKASNEVRRGMLALCIAAHADRIPPTLDYARAQNNNHLLSEAIGLITAAAILPSHRRAKRWRRIGEAALAEGLECQISADGSYAQHSANYQRLMLQLGTWYVAVLHTLGEKPNKEFLQKFGKANDWLAKLLDAESGGVPNLGPNDGAYVLPITVLPFADYSPALQAASLAFWGAPLLKSGAWDEMALWLGLSSKTKKPRTNKSKLPLRLEGRNSWAYLRAAEFKGRPGHADQLHLDLWWRGLNLAQDAGTYLYTAEAPWNNALASTQVHNTVMVNGAEQMKRTGRFLWLDWAQAKVTSTKRNKAGQIVGATAEHDGYRELGITHRRTVRVEGQKWIIEDQLLGEKNSEANARLHWLLPDWQWKYSDSLISLKSPLGNVEIEVEHKVEVALYRAGKRVGHFGESPTEAGAEILGWVSRSYGVKVPALSLVVTHSGRAPLELQTVFRLPK